MKPTLILIRGNSGSGKSTIAHLLQKKLGSNTLRIDQDVVRIDMLLTKDYPNNLAIPLIYELAQFGYKNCPFVILEGILSTSNYESCLNEIIHLFKNNVHAYYFNLPFEETVARHQTRDKKANFGEEDMRRWWKERDLLTCIEETIITEHMSTDQIIDLIVNDLNSLREESIK